MWFQVSKVSVRRVRQAVTCITAGATALLSTGAFAASTWNIATDGTWSTPGNWTPTGVPVSDPTTQLIFGGTTGYTATNDIGPFTLNRMTFNDTVASIVASSPAANTLALAGTTPTLDGTGIGQINSVLAGTTLITKAGTGTVILNATNTYTAGLSISAGRLQVGNAGTTGTLGTGTISIASGATLAFNRTDDTTITNLLTGTGTIEVNSGIVRQSSNSGTFTGTVVINNGGTFRTENQSGTHNLNPTLITVNSGGNYFFGDTLPAGSNPNLPDTTFVAVNTGGNATWLVGEQFGGLNMLGGTQTITNVGLTIVGTGAASSNWQSGTVVGTGTSANVNGAGSILKTTTGTVTVTGLTLNNTGSIDIQNGVISSNVGSTSVGITTLGTTTTSGTLRYSGAAAATVTSSRPITVNSFGGAIDVTTATANFSQTAAVTYTGQLLKSGAGLLTLGAAGTGTGGISMTGGGIVLSNATGMGTGALMVGTGVINAATAASANLPFLTAASTSAFTIANDIVLPAKATPLAVYTIQKNSSGITTGTNLLLSGTISGGAASFMELELNSDTASDNSTTYEFAGNNSFAGIVDLNRGCIILDNSNSIGTASLIVISNTNSTLGNLRFNGAFSFANTVAMNGTGNTIGTGANNVTMSGVVTGTVAWGKLGTGTLTFTGANTDSGAVTITEGTIQVGNGGTTGVLGTGAVVDNSALIFNRSNAVTFAGAISGTGTFTQAGLGTTTLTGANTYTGTTTIAAGTLQIGAGGTIGSIASNIVNNSALIFSRSNALTYSGLISGTGTLTKAGAGALTLTSSNTYTGATSVSAGTLQLTGGTSQTSNITVANLAALGIVNPAATATATSTGGLVFGSVATDTTTLNLGIGNSWDTVTPLLSLGGTITTSGVGKTTINISSATALNSTTYQLISYTGTLAGSGFAGFTLAPLTIPRAVGTLVDDSANHLISLSVTADVPKWTGATDGTWDLNTTQNWQLVTAGTPTTYLDGDNVLFDDSATGPTAITLGFAASPTSVTFANTTGNAASKDYSIGGAGKISGTSSLTVSGGGLAVLTTDNDYSGGTSITSGTLQLGNGGTTGSITGNVSTGSAGKLLFNRSNAMTFAGIVSGSGSVTQAGSNTLTLTGASTYTGGTIINAGTLQIGDGTTSGALPGNVTNNAALVLSPGTAGMTAPGVIGGSGSLTKLGANTAILTGTNTYSGGTTVTLGTLQIGNGTVSGVLPGNVAVTGTLAFSPGPDNPTYAGIISGTGAVSKTGANTQTLTGANTYTGLTTVNAGTLQIGSATTAGVIPGNVTLSGSGTLAFRNPDATDLSYAGVIAGSGTGTVTKLGGNVLTLTGTSTFTNAINITAGTVSAAVSANLGATTNTINFNGGTLALTGSFTSAQTFNFGTGGTVDVASGNTITKNGAQFTGSGPMTKAGAGILTVGNFGGATFTGSINVTNGNLRTTSTRFSTAGDITISSGATFWVFDTSSFKVAVGSTDVVAGTALVLNGDGFGGTGAYLHTLDEAGSTALLVSSPVRLPTTSRFTITQGTSGTRTATDTIVDTFGQPISGAGGLIKDGLGTMNIAAPATYAGTTQVQAGILRFNSTSASTATVTVGNATTAGQSPTLGGTGSIAGPVTFQGSASAASVGHLAPGAGVGTLTMTNSVALEAGSILDYEFNASANDLAVVTNLAIPAGASGTVGVNLFNENATTGYFFPASGVYHLIRITGAAPNASDLSNFSVLNSYGFFNYSFQLDPDGSGGNYVDLSVTVPEPTSISLVGLAAVGLLSRRRRVRVA